jgi:Zn-dependent protease with chaperone function
MADLATSVCPNCGKTIDVDKRFVIWCEQCDWNVDGGLEAPRKSWRQRMEARANRRGQALFLELGRSIPVRPRLSAARVGSFAIAIAIHAATLGTIVLGVYVLATNFPHFFGFAVGVPLVLLGLVLRPHLGKVRPDAIVLSPVGAPAIYELVNRISSEVGGRPVNRIVVDPTFNAAHGEVGIQRRRVLWLGLALWNVLDDQQRVAVVAHEMAHQVNGDLTHGLVVGSALRTLSDWNAFLAIRFRPQGSGGLFEFVTMLAEMLAIGLMRVAGWIVFGLYIVETSLLFRSRQSAEYYADRLAAVIASTEAMIACLDHLNLAEPCTLAVRYAAQRQQDVWSIERQYVDNLTAKEWERLRRLHARQGTRVDSTHPPTNLRIDLLRKQPETTGRIRLTAAESDAIAAEMAHAFGAVGERLVSRLAI